MAISFKNDQGGVEIPPVDGAYFTDNIDIPADSNVISIAAYDSNGDVIVATGTATFAMSPIDGQFVSEPSSGSSVVDLTLAGADATYDLPEYKGPALKGRMILTGVTGAPGVEFIKASVWRR